MPAVIVPARAGVLSAVGLLTAPERRDVVRSWPTPADHAGLDETREELAAAARALLTGDHGDRGDRGDGGAGGTRSGAVDTVDVEVTVALDCRYRGQSHELTVPDVASFHDEHRRRNGYARPDDPIEVVAVRATATRAPRVDPALLPPPLRLAQHVDETGDPGEVRGPAVIAEPDCTVWVADGWVARPGEGGALVLRRAEER